MNPASRSILAQLDSATLEDIYLADGVWLTPEKVAFFLDRRTKDETLEVARKTMWVGIVALVATVVLTGFTALNYFFPKSSSPPVDDRPTAGLSSPHGHRLQESRTPPHRRPVPGDGS